MNVCFQSSSSIQNGHAITRIWTLTKTTCDCILGNLQASHTSHIYLHLQKEKENIPERRRTRILRRKHPPRMGGGAATNSLKVGGCHGEGDCKHTAVFLTIKRTSTQHRSHRRHAPAAGHSGGIFKAASPETPNYHWRSTPACQSRYLNTTSAPEF